MSGLGADEVFGGYARYRSAFKRDGYEAVQAEMELDLNRLWSRNLGRDDRITGYHSREMRYPYLDTKVLHSLSGLPLDQSTTLTKIRGCGDKILLRRIAWELGLRGCAGFEKRAIQFGSRIAKTTNKEMFGSNRKAKGQAKLSDL